MNEYIALLNAFLPALGFLMLNVLIPGPNVLNTVATSIGSSRLVGIYCAYACGLGLLVWAIAALSGAAILFFTFPVLKLGLTLIGALLLWYFAIRYFSRAFSKRENKIDAIGMAKSLAFKRAFFIMITNPKVLTTFLAVISLFPIVTQNFTNILLFSFLSSFASFAGHSAYAVIFSSHVAAKAYNKLYKSINLLVGLGFLMYGGKLFLDIVS